MTEHKNLLIIDDEPSVRGSLAIFFEDEGYTVFSAETGEQGLDLFSKESIDVVLTDLRMPGIDGFGVMKAIREQRPNTPVLVVSGANEKHDIIRALRMGAKDYITKPIRDLEMIAHSVNRAYEIHRLNQDNRKYRQALVKSEQKYRNIAENIAEGVFTADKLGMINYVNHAFCRIMGYSSKQDLLSKSLEKISNQDSFEAIQEQALTPQKGKTSRFEIQLFHRSGQEIQVELACNPIFSDSNEYQGFIAVVRDITELTTLRKKFQKFLTQSDSSNTDVLPICANCKNIKQTEKKWIPVEDHFSTIVFSHGVCPECCEKLYPQFDFSDSNSDD